MEFDPDLVIPNRSLTISQGAIVPWVRTGKDSVAWFEALLRAISERYEFSLNVPVSDLPPYTRNQVEQGIVTDDEVAAQGVVERLRVQAQSCRNALTTPTPTPTPSTVPSLTRTPTGSPSPVQPTAAPTSGATIAAAAGSTTTPTVTPTTLASVAPETDGAATSEDCRGLG